jgi:hypothetical protein
MDAIGSRRLRTMTLCAPALAAVVAALWEPEAVPRGGASHGSI